VADKDNYVLAMDVARPGQDLLVVTEGGYGKRTSVEEYRLTSRGAKGVKTITFTEAKGMLAGALVVREHEELVFISQNGMVQRTSVRGINRYGRASQGVKVMNLRAGDAVSAIALVMESESSTTAAVPDEELPIQLDVDTPTDVEAAVESVDAGPVEDDEEVNPADPTDDSLLDSPDTDEDDLEP
jgi:DNA gyrase subunit A